MSAADGVLQAQQVLVQVSGSKKKQTEIRAALQSGAIPLLRSELRRMSFDSALYERLLSTIPHGVSLVGGSAEQAVVDDDYDYD
jgi:hypothetical protein